MKRTSVKVLISASIIFAMIPFYFINVKADINQRCTLSWAYSYDVTTINNAQVMYMNIDVYYVSYYGTTGHSTVGIGNQNSRGLYFAVTLLDSEGSVSTTYTENAGRFTITTAYQNCTYYHYRIQYRSNNNWWTAARLSNPYGALDFTPNYTNTSMAIDVMSTGTALAKIMSSLNTMINNGLTVDFSNILPTLEEFADNQETIIAQLNDIKELLEAQQDSPEQGSVDDNTQANDDLQTEQTTYENLEQQFNSDFTDNLNDINVTDWQTRLNNWSTGVNWLKTQMNTMFNAMGDYKYMLEIGMILAIALIFIGR